MDPNSKCLQTGVKANCTVYFTKTEIRHLRSKLSSVESKNLQTTSDGLVIIEVSELR